MTQSVCIYHPKKIAESKCEICEKPLCSACIRPFSRHYPRGRYRSAHTDEFVICPLCLNDQIQNQSPLNPVLKVMGGLVAVILPLWWLCYGRDTGGMGIIFVIFSILGALVIVEGIQEGKKFPLQQQKSEEETQAFLAQIDASSNNSTN